VFYDFITSEQKKKSRFQSCSRSARFVGFVFSLFLSRALRAVMQSYVIITLYADGVRREPIRTRTEKEKKKGNLKERGTKKNHAGIAINVQ